MYTELLQLSGLCLAMSTLWEHLHSVRTHSQCGRIFTMWEHLHSVRTSSQCGSTCAVWSICKRLQWSSLFKFDSRAVCPLKMAPTSCFHAFRFDGCHTTAALYVEGYLYLTHTLWQVTHVVSDLLRGINVSLSVVTISTRAVTPFVPIRGRIHEGPFPASVNSSVSNSLHS